MNILYLEIKMENTSNIDCKYNSLKEDPQFLLTLLNKYVKIEIIKEISFRGYLLAIDPESYSIVLAALNDGDTYKHVLIHGHAILNIIEDRLPANAKQFVTSSQILSPEDIAEKKIKIISWFKKNLLPVSEVDENIVLGNAYILPPYTQLDICAENPIVVNQIKSMILRMPDNYDCS